MNRHLPLPALALAATPRGARWMSRLAMVLLLALPALLAIPWQQNVHGTGRVVAFNPVHRPQFIVSPMEGRVRKWHVVEGERIKAGQRLVDLIDNDPLLEERLQQERVSLEDRRRAAAGRIEQIERTIRNLESSFNIQKAQQAALVEIESQQLLRANQDRIDADAALLAAEQHEARTKELAPRGATQRDVEMAVRDTVQTRARVEGAKLGMAARSKALEAAREFLKRIDADQATAVSREAATLDSARADLAASEIALTAIGSRIARQRNQYIESPCDGVVHRLLANAEMGGILVRPGERLAMIVPDIKPVLPAEGADVMPGVVAELFIDGNDLPLVRVGDAVRLQFEGWPAVQFASRPEAAAGTFGGRIRLVDPAANERGQFRILVEPDVNDHAWPNEDYLRQGVQAHGWVLLDRTENRVSLGWELWRMLNGFPVTRSLETKPSR